MSLHFGNVRDAFCLFLDEYAADIELGSHVDLDETASAISNDARIALRGTGVSLSNTEATVLRAMIRAYILGQMDATGDY